jgi:hypothetical protein
MHADEVPPPVQMVQLLSGFQISQALYVAAKLGIPDALVDGPRPVAEVAAAVGADERATRRLLRTLASLGLFTHDGGGTVSLTPLGATLATGTPGSMRDLALMWMETHYDAFGELLDGVRQGKPAADLHYGMPFFGWLSGQPEQIVRFSGAMGNLTGGIKAAAIAGTVVEDAGTIVDVGGANGEMLASLLARHPQARGILYDLPHVVPGSAKAIAEVGLAARVEVVGGDFFTSVPAGDTYLLSFVLHDWADDECVTILERIREANAGARLVVVEFVVPPTDEPHMAKMIDLTMLGMLTGCERTESEWRALLARAGFTLDAIESGPSPLSVLRAHAT